MSWIQNFIQQDKFLSEADEIWRHQFYVAGKKGSEWQLKTFFHRPVSYLKNGRWTPIDENIQFDGSKFYVPHTNFIFSNGIIQKNNYQWKPTRFGGFGKKFSPIHKLDPILVKGNRLLWERGDYRYQYEIQSDLGTEGLILQQLPDTSDPYFALEYKTNCLPSRPFVEDAWGRKKDCDLVVDGNLVYAMVGMEWLEKAHYPVVLDPEYDIFASCYVGRVEIHSDDYYLVHDLSPLSCDNNLASFHGTQSNLQDVPGDSDWAWQRMAIKADIGGVVTAAVQAYSSWAKVSEGTPIYEDYEVYLYMADWSVYDTGTYCQFGTCTNGGNINVIIRDSATQDVKIADFNDPFNTYKDTGSMDLTWVNYWITDGGGYIYYAVKVDGDHTSTPTPAADVNEGCALDGPAASNPAYLTLIFETATHIFGTILG